MKTYRLITLALVLFGSAQAAWAPGPLSPLEMETAELITAWNGLTEQYTRLANLFPPGVNRAYMLARGHAVHEAVFVLVPVLDRDFNPRYDPREALARLKARADAYTQAHGEFEAALVRLGL